MDNLFAFHGIDHKVGVTMVAQSIAELIASKNSNIKVLFISLNGRGNCEYIKEKVKTIDEFKLQMDSQILISKDFVRDCRYKTNLYVLAGLENEHEKRYYFPDSIQYLLESVSTSFDVIIADTGSELDNGLALGGLSTSAKNYLILTQLESNYYRYDKRKNWFLKAKIDFDKVIINKFSEEDPHTFKYISERLPLDKNKILKIGLMEYARQAELEHKTFTGFKADKYLEEITMIANSILDSIGLSQIKVQRKNKLWKNFI